MEINSESIEIHKIHGNPLQIHSRSLELCKSMKNPKNHSRSREIHGSIEIHSEFQSRGNPQIHGNLSECSPDPWKSIPDPWKSTPNPFQIRENPQIHGNLLGIHSRPMEIHRSIKLHSQSIGIRRSMEIHSESTPDPGKSSDPWKSIRSPFQIHEHPQIHGV